MKPFITFSMLAVGLSLPLWVNAQEGLQRLPEGVSGLMLKESTSLVVVPDTLTAFELTEGKMKKYTQVRAGVLEVNSNKSQVKLHLRSDDLCSFHATDMSQLLFDGNFTWSDTLSVVADGSSQVTVSKLGRTVKCPAINLHADGFANIKSEGSLQMERYHYRADGLSSLTISESRHVNMASGTDGGTIVDEELSSISIDRIIYINGDTGSYHHPEVASYNKLLSVTNEVIRNVSTSKKWHSTTDFAWGFHNWSSQLSDGFAGASGAAGIRTSFNHLLLSFNYPLCQSAHAALYAGLGLEWDKYKFNGGDIRLNTVAGEPYRFEEMSDPAVFAHTQLLTRYVVLPVSACFRLGNSKWKLELAAIPGIHWSGSHTGFRRQSENAESTLRDKDYSVNKYINPYKLDLRAVVRYRGMGVYLQVPTMPALRESCEKLYPIKFGIIF